MRCSTWLGSVAVVLAALGAACGPDGRGTSDDGDGGAGAVDAGPGADARPFADAGPPLARAIYLSTRNELYLFDPDTHAVTRIGAFDFGEGMVWPITDIAVDAEGGLFAMGFGQLYRVNPETAKLSELTTFEAAGDFNSLSWVPAGVILPDREVLLAGTYQGALWWIDPLDGAATYIGLFGSGLGSSGDLVSVRDFGTFMTATSGDGYDSVVRLNEASGHATVVGPTGSGGFYGLAFWEGVLYGFDGIGGIWTVDPSTGAATQIDQIEGVNWTGAGVTTLAPVID